MQFQTGKSEPPANFLEQKVFSVLLPGLEETLQVAKKTEVCKYCVVHDSTSIGR